MKVKVWKLLSLIFIIIFALSIARVVYAAGLTATITVGFAPLGIAYDSAKGEIFVANAGSPGGFNVTSQAGTNTISVISDSNNKVIASIDMGTPPGYVVYDSGKGEIFVTAFGGDKVFVISDSTNSIVANVTVGTYPLGEAYDSGKGEIFVCNGGDNNVSVISDSTNAVVATIAVGANPKGAAYDSAMGEIFVTNGNSNTVSVISDSTNTVVATINLPTGNGPNFVAYDPGKAEIFVTDSGNYVYVISDSTNVVVATVDLNLNHEVSPDGLAYDSSRGEMFVANFGTNDVSILSDNTNNVVGTVNLPVIDHFASPFFLAYDSAKGEVFVTNQALNTVSVISDSSSTSASPTPTTAASPISTTSASSTPNSSSPGFSSIDLLIAIIIIIIILALIILGWSKRRNLTVTVQDAQTRSPIPGASVSASGPQTLSGATENNGKILFSNPKAGDYSIKASAAGYNASTPTSVQVKNKTKYIVKLDSVEPKTQAGTPSASSGGPKYEDGGSGSGVENKESSQDSNVIPQAPAYQTQQAQTQVTRTIQQGSVLPTDMKTAESASPPLSQQEPTELQGLGGERIQQTIKTFQEKGAISPETALTAKELGLSRIFVRIMERRKEQTRIFVEINGRYYLNQKALEEKT